MLTQKFALSYDPRESFWEMVQSLPFHLPETMDDSDSDMSDEDELQRMALNIWERTKKDLKRTLQEVFREVEQKLRDAGGVFVIHGWPVAPRNMTR